MTTPCRWGILGAAKIARKNWKAIRKAENSTLVAVASRDRAKARQFIDECQSDVSFPTPPAACGSYEELLARPDVDAVYIPLPTGVRKEWVIRAAEAGKHVLSEKPCGVNAADLREMLAACEKHRVQFMDGVMFMHSARLPLLRSVLDDGTSVGDVRRVVSEFSFHAGEDFYRENIRANASTEPLGCLGDLGWYNLRFSLWVMRFAMPRAVSGRMVREHQGVPTEFSGELLYADGATASFYCSFRTSLHQSAAISGAKGYVDVPDFVIPFMGPEPAFDVTNALMRVEGCSYHFERRSKRFAVAEYDAGAPESQETNMVRAFADLAKSGKPDPTWGEFSLKTQLVLDACLQSARDGGKLVDIA